MAHDDLPDSVHAMLDMVIRGNERVVRPMIRRRRRIWVERRGYCDAQVVQTMQRMEHIQPGHADVRMGFLGVVSIAPSESGADDEFEAEGDRAFATSSAAATRQASRTTFVSIIQVKSLPVAPPALRPWGPLKSCWIIFPASSSDTEKTAAKLARACGETLATNSFPSV